jgi:LmbE family N-acetylglucosaminyl deacetylase
VSAVASVYREAPATALAIYAHPDDAEISCGATIAKWVASGSAVHLVTCTRGDKGASDPMVDADELVIRRSSEIDDAAAVLGLSSVRRLGHLDGEIENDLDLRRELVALVREIRPDAVICPDPLAVFFGEHYFNHRDHRIVGWAVLDAVAPASSSPLYFPESGEAHEVATVFLSGSLEANLYVDVSSSIDVKAEAVLCHRSQLGADPGWLRSVVFERAAEAGREVGIRYAEGFRRIRLAR